MKHTFWFKDNETLINSLRSIDSKLLVVFAHFVKFCDDHSLPCVVTNVWERFPQSKHNQHPEGRAIDCRSNGWAQDKIDACIEYMHERVGYLGAYRSDGSQNCCYYHDAGLGAHFHLQVHR